MLSAGHAVPLIPKDPLRQFFGNDLVNSFETAHLEVLKQPENKVIQPVENCRANLAPKIATWDLETHTAFTTPHVYLSGLAWRDENGERFEQFNTDNRNLDQFFDYVVDHAEEFNGYTFYAHCGGRFDLNLLIRDVLSKRTDIRFGKVTELNGTWLNMGVSILKTKEIDGVKKRKSYKITFRDSYRLFLAPLSSVTKDLCKNYQKGHLDHGIINILARHVANHNELMEVP